MLIKLGGIRVFLILVLMIETILGIRLRYLDEAG